jgi:hypothetical protein
VVRCLIVSIITYIKRLRLRLRLRMRLGLRLRFRAPAITPTAETGAESLMNLTTRPSGNMTTRGVRRRGAEPTEYALTV